MERRAWMPFNDVFKITQEFVHHKKDDIFHRTKSLLQSYKPEFLSLLQNVERNAEDRSKVSNAGKVGLTMEGEVTPKTLDEQFIADVLVLSDLLQLNEISCVDLLFAAEQQKTNYTGCSRLLVAILMYWDGRRNLVGALRTLILCRKGPTWTFDLPDAAVAMATAFTGEVLANGLTGRVLKLLGALQTDAELDRLTEHAHFRQQLSPRYAKQIRDIILEVRLGLAECVFYFSGQASLPLNDIVAVIEHLKSSPEADEEQSGVLTPPTLALLFAVFYSISVPQSNAFDDAEDAERFLAPLHKDKEFLPKIHKMLTIDSAQLRGWKVPGILASLQYVWSLTLARTPSTTDPPSRILEQDEAVLDMSLAGHVFQFLKSKVVASSGFHQEEFYVRYVHDSICDLISNMPLKIKEIRNHGDEVARIQQLHLARGEEAPKELRKDFEEMMDLISAVYSEDPLGLELSLNYWCPTDLQPHSASLSSSLAQRHRISQKQASLFKFVRQSGDLLPPLLYISYIRMVTSLATGARSSRAAFEMLRMNGAANGGGDEGGTVSWNHFFLSMHRYYEHLQDRPIHDHMTSQQLHDSHKTHGTSMTSHMARLITPEEVEGLRAVLGLISTVAKYDDVACISIFDNPHWSTCGVLFGLLQCPIPVVLKADILGTLTSMARIPDVAASVLQGTESAQLLHAKPGSAQTKKSGLVAELEEVESHGEEYPMTRSFLKLLHLLASLLTDAVGSNARERHNTFNTCLDYVIESVFNKSYSRGYLRGDEKWQVQAACLRIFTQFLRTYSPDPGHFRPHPAHPDHRRYDVTNTSHQLMEMKWVGNPPGHTLLLHVYTESNIFKIVMQIVKECLEYLSTYKTDPKSEKTLVEAAQLAMSLLLLSLELQRPFFSALRESGRPILLSGLDKLLLGLNPKTGKSDYIIHICSFVQYNASHPLLALQAVQLLSRLAFSSPANHRAVVMATTNSCDKPTRQRIFQGFVEILDASCDGGETESGETTGQKCQEAVVRLLIHCLDFPPPNLSLLLLGFDFNKNPGTVNLQDPGVYGSVRSCLHSVLNLLTHHEEQEEQPSSTRSAPLLARLCFQLVFKLAANLDTTVPVLRYLRSSYDFLTKQVQHLPFKCFESSDSNHNLLQQAWLMQTIAIEVYSLLNNQQRSNAQRIIQLLVKAVDPADAKPPLPETSCRLLQDLATLPPSALTASFYRARQHESSMLSMTCGNDVTNAMMTSSVGMDGVGCGREENLKLLKILDVVDFTQEFPRPLVLEQFVPAMVEETITSCEVADQYGLVYCDIKALHSLIEAGLGTLTGLDDGNRKLLAAQDVKNILQTAVERNRVRETISSKLSFLSSWKQMLEVAVMSHGLLPLETKEQVLMSVATCLMRKVHEEGAAQELTSPLATTAFVVIAQIRQLVTSADHKDSSLGAEDKIKSKLAAQLQVVIRGLIEWTQQPGMKQKVRVHLYSSLLCYLRLCRRPPNRPTQEEPAAFAHEDIYSQLIRDNISLIREYGDAFMALLCRDASIGHSVCRALSLACLDAIIEIDFNQTWINFIVKHGYISTLAYSLLEEGPQLSLSTSADPLRAVCIYEQKVALLCTIAQSPVGARAVLDSGVLGRLQECEFLDERPPPDAGAEGNLMLEHHRRLAFPCLRLCSAVLATLGGPSHHEASAMVLQFLLSHVDAVIYSVIDYQCDFTDLQSLTEWKLLTGLLCQTTGQNFNSSHLFAGTPPDVLLHLRSYLLRIQRQLITVLPKFFLTDYEQDELMQNLESNSETAPSFDQVSKLMSEIGANILTLLRHTSSRDLATSSPEPLPIFAPNLDEAPFDPKLFPSGSRRANLGLLVRILRTSSAEFQAVKEKVNARKEESPAPQQQEEKLSCLYYVIENSLLLIWQHVEYYVMRYVPSDVTSKRILFRNTASASSARRKELRSLQDTSGFSDSLMNEQFPRMTSSDQLGISPDDIEKLKRGLGASLPEHVMRDISSSVTLDRPRRVIDLVRPITRRLQQIVNLHTDTSARHRF